MVVDATMTGGRGGGQASYCYGLLRPSALFTALLVLALVSSRDAEAASPRGAPMSSAAAEEILRRLHYTLSSLNVSPGEEPLTVVNLDLIPDDVIAMDVEDGVQEEFDNIDREMGDQPDSEANAPLPEHRIDRQMSLIYQGVYVPDARFNPFVDGIMVNMVAEMRRRQMDPLYFSVREGGGVKHVSTSRQHGVPKSMDASSPQGLLTEEQEQTKPKRKTIGGGVVRGLTKLRRFGNAEVQTIGNATLVRSHYVFGPLDVELVFDTTENVTLVESTLTSLAGHGLARVNASNAEFLDFIIDSPADYEIKLRGSKKNERLRRLSRTAILKLVRREGRLERRLMRMFGRAGKKPIPEMHNARAEAGLWPTYIESEQGDTSGTVEVPQKKEPKITGKKPLPVKKVQKEKLEKMKLTQNFGIGIER